jgi:hypothetical protein
MLRVMIAVSSGIGAVMKPKAVKADGKWYLAGP